MTLPIALDAMGGDLAPGEIIAGARRAVDELGLSVTLVGVPELLGDPLGLEVVPCGEVIAMDEEPGSAVRHKKDSSLVRAAELVRDGRASAMVSAGNTGATMAAALLRIGRLPGVARPCIATPIPRDGSPMILVDAGANSECTPEMLVQFAQMGSAFVRAYYGTARPSVGLLSIGEESTKGTPLVKATHSLLASLETLNFVGNVEGRDLMPSPVDVVVTDGFTGNVALKTMEGALRYVISSLLGAIDATEETRAAGAVLFSHLAPVVSRLTVENQGGALLLGLKGVCVIGHGSSNATATMNALRVAHEQVEAQVVDSLRSVIRPDQGD